MNKPLAPNAVDFYSADLKFGFDNIETYLRNFVQTVYLHVSSTGGVITGFEPTQYDSTSVKLSPSSTGLSLLFDANGNLFVGSTSYIVGLADPSDGAANYILAKYSTSESNINKITGALNGPPRVSYVDGNLYNTIQLDNWILTSLTDSQWWALTDAQRKEYVVLGNVTVNGSSFIINTSYVTYLSVTVPDNSIFDRHVNAAALIKIAKFATNINENPNFFGSENNFEDYVNRIISEIKALKGYSSVIEPAVSWRAPSRLNVLQTDNDFNTYWGEGIVKDAVTPYNEGLRSHFLSTDFNIETLQGKIILNKIFQWLTLPLYSSVLPPSFITVASEGHTFGPTKKFSLNCNGTPHCIFDVTKNLDPLDNLRYGVSGCTFTTSSGYLVIYKEGHKFLENDWIVINNTANYNSDYTFISSTGTGVISTAIASGTVTPYSFAVNLSSVGAGGENANNDDTDGFVALEVQNANSSTRTHVGVDYYGKTASIIKIDVNASTTDTFNYNYFLPRIDAMYLDISTMVLSILTGTPSSNPVSPTVVDVNKIKLYDVYVGEFVDNIQRDYYISYDQKTYNTHISPLSQHINRVEAINDGALIDKRQWLQKHWEHEFTESENIYLTNKYDYGNRTIKKYTYKNDGRVSKIDFINPQTGDLNTEFLYKDEITNTNYTDLMTEYMYNHAEGKSYIKNITYIGNIEHQDHLTVYSLRAPGYILKSINNKYWVITLSSSGIITTNDTFSIANITDVEHDIPLEIFGNGALMKDNVSEVIHKLFVGSEGALMTNALTNTYINYSSRNILSPFNYIRFTNHKYGIVFKDINQISYRLRINNEGALFTETL